MKYHVLFVKRWRRFHTLTMLHAFHHFCNDSSSVVENLRLCSAKPRLFLTHSHRVCVVPVCLRCHEVLSPNLCFSSLRPERAPEQTPLPVSVGVTYIQGSLFQTLQALTGQSWPQRTPLNMVLTAGKTRASKRHKVYTELASLSDPGTNLSRVREKYTKLTCSRCWQCFTWTVRCCQEVTRTWSSL